MTSMKRMMAMTALALVTLGSHAQREGQNPEYAKQQLEQQLAARTSKLVKKTNYKKWVDDINVRWEDGEYMYEVVYDEEEKTLLMGAMKWETYNWQPTDLGYKFVLKGSRLQRSDNTKLVIDYETAGTWQMLVVRNSKTGNVEDIFLPEKDAAPTETQFQQDAQDLLGGVYRLRSIEENAPNDYRPSDEDKAYFGSIWLLESRDLKDPGAFLYTGNCQLQFGDGRMKYVEQPPMPKFEVRADEYGRPHFMMDDVELPDEATWNREREERMPRPGYGGHGALMGPTLWSYQLTADGMKVHAELQNGVRDYPCFGQKFELTKERGYYEGIDGVWPVASVRPLTRGMLKQMTKDGLQLMLNEIYARHGQSFKDAATQTYFNSQSWYKKAKKPSALTAIEQLNVSMLKGMISQ